MAFQTETTFQYNGWRLKMMGSGVAYLLIKIEEYGERSVFFQDDDAIIFENTLKTYQKDFPNKDDSQILAKIWEDQNYDLIAETRDVYLN